MSAIEFLSLTKWYGSSVLGVEDVSFAVNKGEIFGYLGPNGSGKSTTIRCAMGFLKPSSGETRIFGNTVRPGHATGHERIGFLPGDFKLWPRLTARRALSVLGALDGGGHRSASKRQEELAERLRLDLDRPIGKLSKGNRQKVGLVFAFQNDPDLLILDEPTTGLDPLIATQTLDLIRATAESGKTVFLSSHDLAQVASVCHRTAILRQGRLVELAEIDAILARSEHPMRVWFSESITPFPRSQFSNAEVIEESDRFIHLRYRGSPDAILKWLAGFPVQRLITPEPTLEEAFLDYYRTDRVNGESR